MRRAERDAEALRTPRMKREEPAAQPARSSPSSRCSAAVLLAMSALKDQASYFYAPGDSPASRLPVGKAVRIGGMVRKGSMRIARTA